jgi:chromosome segregation ATPase
MENKNPFRLTVRVLLFIVTTVTFLLPGCKTGALKDQVMMLSEKQTSLANERDSLQRLLEIKTLEVNAINKSYDTLNSDFNNLTIKNKSLLSGYYTRGEQLKKAIKENSEMSNSADYLSAKNDSLQSELRYLQEKIAAIDKEMHSRITQHWR